MSARGTVATGATGGIGHSGLIERRDLDQVDQLDALHQQLRDSVATVDHDRRRWVEIDQRDLDLTTVTRIDGAGTVDDRKSHPRSQTGPRVHETYHPDRNGHRDSRPHQRPVSGRKLDVFGAVEVYAGITVVGPGGQRKPGVETNNRQTGRHGGTDYP